jgi:hypothetical protein
LTIKYQKDTYVKGVQTKTRIIEDIYVQKRGIVATSTKIIIITNFKNWNTVFKKHHCSLGTKSIDYKHFVKKVSYLQHEFFLKIKSIKCVSTSDKNRKKHSYYKYRFTFIQIRIHIHSITVANT